MSLLNHALVLRRDLVYGRLLGDFVCFVLVLLLTRQFP
jgi:hypothetical protein